MSFHDVIGLGGVALVVGAYVALQVGRLRETDRLFPVLNAAGSAAVLYSLVFDFNVAAALMNVTWLVISLASLARPAARADLR